MLNSINNFSYEVKPNSSIGKSLFLIPEFVHLNLLNILQISLKKKNTIILFCAQKKKLYKC